jgi:hypothetical protein
MGEPHVAKRYGMEGFGPPLASFAWCVAWVLQKARCVALINGIIWIRALFGVSAKRHLVGPLGPKKESSTQTAAQRTKPATPWTGLQASGAPSTLT